MFSGGDSSDDINNINQFGSYGFVNQVAVSNAVAAGQNIDWAQLAQQWIQMRDNSELEAKTEGTAGSKVDDVASKNFKFEEKGEADMDMDDEEQSDDKTSQKSNNGFIQTDVNLLNQLWFPGESNSQIDPQPTSNNQWNPWSNRENLPNKNDTNNRQTTSTAHIPSLLKITVSHPNEIRVMPDVPNQLDNINMIDAAKRKGLPAWIREGLEKMEREKQKQLEKIKQNKDTNLSDEENSSNNNLVVNSIKSLSGVGIKNVFNAQGINTLFRIFQKYAEQQMQPVTDLYEETSDNEETVTTKGNSQHDANLKEIKEEDDTHSSSEDQTYEQKLAELMIVVRRTLTELLLETTNEEISKVADETIKIMKSKASSAQVIRKSALSTLTDKLGLGAYGDSSTENDSDSEDSNSSKKASEQSESHNDSEEELRNIIRLKTRAFIKISEDIDQRVDSAAAREEEKLKYFLRKEEEEKEHNHGKQDRSLLRDSSTSGHSGHNILKGFEKDFGEITETKIQHLNGKRQRERSSRRERTTRFSDNKDKYVTLPNAATLLTNLNSGKNFGSGKNTPAAVASSQWQNIPDTGLLPNYTSSGMTSALTAADAALEKALKAKSLTNNAECRRHDRDRGYNHSKKRRRRTASKHSRSRSKSSSSSTSSSSSSISSESDSSSTSRSSHHSKYKHRSQKKYNTKNHNEKSRKDSKSDRKHSSYSHKKSDRESSSRSRRNVSSDSEDDYYRRHKYDSHYRSNSSRSRTYSSSKRSHDREHSRSQSRSYSSSNHRQ